MSLHADTQSLESQPTPPPSAGGTPFGHDALQLSRAPSAQGSLSNTNYPRVQSAAGSLNNYGLPRLNSTGSGLGEFPARAASANGIAPAPQSLHSDFPPRRESCREGCFGRHGGGGRKEAPR